MVFLRVCLIKKLEVLECWSLENFANWSFNTEGIVKELFFALNGVELYAWFFKLVEIGIFEFAIDIGSSVSLLLLLFYLP